MELLDVLSSAWSSLRSNKTRTALTLLGMIIGVFAIITSVTAVKVIDVYFEEKMSFLGTGTFTISRYPSMQMNGRNFDFRPNITVEQVERLRESLDGNLVLSAQEDFEMTTVGFEGRETEPNILLLGSDENFLGNFSYTIDYGRSFTAEDNRYSRKLIVLGSSIADELFPSQSPLGKVVDVGGNRFTIIGVLEPKGNFLGFNMDNRVFAPMETLLNLYGGANRNVATTSVRAPAPHLVPAAMDEVIGRLRTIRKVPPGEENNFDLETNDSMRAIFDAFTGTLTAGGAGIGLIALFAAGIGIMNIMLVSVTERTREIGIRKSVGARRRDILGQFIVEAVILCQIGGTVGILLGILVGNVVAVYFDITSAVPWGWAIAAVGMVTVVALVFGGYPALKAARMDPIESLRHEL
jgi:putative ABC transport system permease protein